MISNSVKSDVINSIISVAYYWMGEQNKSCSLSIIKLLYQLKLTTVQGKKVDDLYNDYNTIFKDNKTMHSTLTIPKQYDTDEKQLMWVAGTVILNLFNSGNFELGYTQLMDMAIDWNDLYVYVINSLKQQPFKNEIADWLVTHMLMAYDLLGQKEIESLGYKIQKI